MKAIQLVHELAAVSMAAKESTPDRHEALQVASDKIIESLSADPLLVANSLFAKKMIPQGVQEAMLLGGKTNREKATQIVGAVLTHVKNFPGDFEAFVEVLNEQSCMKGLVEIIEHQLEV